MDIYTVAEESYKRGYENGYAKGYAKGKTEAINDFACKVKEKMEQMCYAEDAYIPYPFTFVDDIVKEMMEENV